MAEEVSKEVKKNPVKREFRFNVEPGEVKLDPPPLPEIKPSVPPRPFPALEPKEEPEEEPAIYLSEQTLLEMETGRKNVERLNRRVKMKHEE